jgi:putative FmdB family regulatory protein
MPVYDYRCRDCGRLQEVFLRSADASPPSCAGCGGERLERVPSAFHMLSPTRGGGSTTCCGRDERCDSPPCSTDDVCRRR